MSKKKTKKQLAYYRRVNERLAFINMMMVAHADKDVVCA
jgi:hypothetical protein